MKAWKKMGLVTLVAWALAPLTAFAVSTESPRHAEAVWIDSDIIIGRFWRDVDDGLALMQALRSPEIEVRGLSLVRGVEYGEKVTHRILDWFAPEWDGPVAVGAAGPGGYDTPTAAVTAMRDALLREPLTLIVIGPITNVAALLTQHPEVASRIRRIVFYSGRRPGERFILGRPQAAMPDFNFEWDVEAFRRVLATRIPLALVGYAPSIRIFFNRDDVREFGRQDLPGYRWLNRKLKSWLVAWRLVVGTKGKGFVPWDAATVGYVTHPERFRCDENIPIEVNVRANDRQGLPFDNFGAEKPYLEASHEFTSARLGTYCYDLDPGFKEVLLDRLLQNRSSAYP